MLPKIYIANTLPQLVFRVNEIIDALNGGTTGNAAFALLANNSNFVYGKNENQLNANSALTANNATFAYGKTEGNLNVNSANFATSAGDALTLNGHSQTYYTDAGNIIVGLLAPARMTLANTTVNGAISTTTQSFAGTKNFVDIAVALQILTPYTLMAGVGGPSPPATVFSFTSGGSKYGTVQIESSAGAGAWSLGIQDAASNAIGTPVLTWNGNLAVILANTLSVAGNSTLTGNTTVVGFANIRSTLEVAGLTTLTGNATLSGFANVAGKLVVAGNSALSGNVTFSDRLTGNGNFLTTLNATELGSGTVPTARLGSGVANSTTILYGDQTYKVFSGATVGDAIALAIALG